MVNIDRVYQKVLALANKEQRGYITPQEFNLLADKAQMELINDYFHAIKTANLKPKNQTENSDEIGMVREKLNAIRTSRTYELAGGPGNDAGFYSVLNYNTTTPDADDGHTIYMVATVRKPINSGDGTEITEVDNHTLRSMLSNPLTSPTRSRPVYIRANNTITQNTNQHVYSLQIYPAIEDSYQNLEIEYWMKPPRPNWGYVVVNQKALYNFNTSTNFFLHASEEEPLVMRILQLAGVTIEKPELQQSVMVDQQTTKQNQNS
tara:strand:+ start:1117 stop:1905 length:789 start_codon:yes stop_codon:yes gene_type:complete